MNANQINTAISEGTWTNEELEGMIYCIKYARSRLGNQVKYKLRIGDNVNFTHSKTYRKMTGHVTNIAIKYVTVRTIDGLWKVPANMLTKVEEMA